MSGEKLDDHLTRLEKDKRWTATRVRKKRPWNDHRLAYLIEWYRLIRSGAQSGFGHQPIAWSEMLAFRALFRLDVDPFDAEALRRLDVVWLKCLPKPESDSPG